MPTITFHRAPPPGLLSQWRGLDRQSRILAGSIAASILLHAVALAVHFRLPEAIQRSIIQPLEVTIVNTRTRERPTKAERLAQANLDRGGDTDQKLRASTPLPVINTRESGADLVDAQRRVQELEAKQRELLAAAQSSKAAVPTGSARETPEVEPQPNLTGRDMADLARMSAKIEADLEKRIQRYNDRPKKLFVGARAQEHQTAQYIIEWIQKVERIGTLNFPADARGKLYGTLQLSVTIWADGRVAQIDLDRSSGLKILDDAARRIAEMAAPYARFPATLGREYDQLVITRTWQFGQDERLLTR